MQIWKAPVQQRVRAFLWLACHDRILSNLNLFKRKLTDSPACYICGNHEETTLHILRDCPAAKMLWRKLIQSAHFAQFFQGSIKEWLELNLTGTENHMAEDWPTIFGLATWWIWRWRNCQVFHRRDEIPVDMGAFLRIRVEETKRSLSQSSNDPVQGSKQKSTTNISWLPPEVDAYVLNCDGAVKGCPGPVGGGGIIRNHEGRFISRFTANFGWCNSIRAEILALVKGLKLAQNLQIKKLEVQLDNLACVQILQKGDANGGENIHEIRDCLRMLRNENWKVKVAHIYREGNRTADWLANRGVLQDTPFCIVNFIPLEFGRILDEDARGVTRPRLVPL